MPHTYLTGPFPTKGFQSKLSVGERMPVSSGDKNQRRRNRTKAVLPVRVKGVGSDGKPFEELVHTLDVTGDGVRLGSVRRQLNLLDEITVFYRQRKIQFRVVWTKRMSGTSEFQVGLQALSQDSEAWGLSFPEFKRNPAVPSNIAGASASA